MKRLLAIALVLAAFAPAIAAQKAAGGSFTGKWEGTFTLQRTLTNSNGTVSTTLPDESVYINDGSFKIGDRPTEAGEYTYTVQWAGNDTLGPAKASHVVTVRERN